MYNCFIEPGGTHICSYELAILCHPTDDLKKKKKILSQSLSLGDSVIKSIIIDAFHS